VQRTVVSQFLYCRYCTVLLCTVFLFDVLELCSILDICLSVLVWDFLESICVSSNVLDFVQLTVNVYNTQEYVMSCNKLFLIS